MNSSWGYFYNPTHAGKIPTYLGAGRYGYAGLGAFGTLEIADTLSGVYGDAEKRRKRRMRKRERLLKRIAKAKAEGDDRKVRRLSKKLARRGRRGVRKARRRQRKGKPLTPAQRKMLTSRRPKKRRRAAPVAVAAEAEAMTAAAVAEQEAVMEEAEFADEFEDDELELFEDSEYSGDLEGAWTGEGCCS